MKVTFLTPPALEGKRAADRVFGCNYGYYPVPNIFILTCAAYLRNAGNEVSYIDGTLDNWSAKDLVEFLKKDKSDLYVIYTVYLAKSTDLKTLELIRKYRNNVKVAFSGPVPTETPDIFIKDDNTYVVRGEPEITLKELVERLEAGQKPNGIQSVSYKDNGEIIHNEYRKVIDDLDSLPFPARDLAEKYKYQYYNPKLGIRPFTVVLSSRGCCYQCTYCVPCSLSFARELDYKAYLNRKPPVRQRSAKNVLEELHMLKNEGYKSISFIDDQFIWNEDRVLEICDGIKKIGIEFGILARADRLTEPIVKALKEANCKYVDIGVESFNQKILDSIQKDLDVNTIYYAIDLLKKYNITCKINVLIAASPLETEETIMENIKIIKKIKPDSVMYGITNPFPGTDFHKVARKEGWMLYDEYKPVDVQKECIISYPHLNNKKIEKLARMANRQFFLSPSFVFQNLKKIRTPRDFLKACISFKRKLFE